MYGNEHNYILQHFTSEIMSELYRTVIIDNIGGGYFELISEYRNMINSCNADKKSQKKLLKLKYYFHKDFYDFNKISDELTVFSELDRAQDYLISNQYSCSSIFFEKFHPYESFISEPRWMWKRVMDNYNEIELDLERKIGISSDLMTYSIEYSNKRLSMYQLIIALLTFALLIFPEKVDRIADVLNTIFEYLTGLG